MNEGRNSRVLIRRRATGYSLIAMAGLIGICIFARCTGGQPVTAESLALARRAWEEAGIRNYDLEWMASGNMSAHYLVTVRHGQVAQIESIAAGGRKFAVHPADPRFYGVDGLFTTIADDLAQLGTGQPFGQPKGTKVVMRFTPDPRLGYPRSYRRDVLGTPQALAIDVIRLIPAETKSSVPAAGRQ
jgi:hypothetical protein